MPAQPSLTRLPVDNDVVATHVDIDCSGLDPDKEVEFLINDVIRGTIAVDLVGDATLLYIVPAGPIRNALRDLGHGEGNIDTVDGVNLVFVEADSGSMALRYKL